MTRKSQKPVYLSLFDPKKGFLVDFQNVSFDLASMAKTLRVYPEEIENGLFHVQSTQADVLRGELGLVIDAHAFEVFLSTTPPPKVLEGF